VTEFISKYPFWPTYYYKHHADQREALLQQMYGIYRCNQAVLQYSASTGVDYVYKIRLREDMAWLAPLPHPDTMQLGESVGGCRYTVRVVTKKAYPGGTEDNFAVGLAPAMDRRMGVYADYVYGDRAATTRCTIDQSHGLGYWTSEVLLNCTLYQQYGVCLTQDEGIRGVVSRNVYHDHGTRSPGPNPVALWATHSDWAVLQ
jgi:hypothetical protein